jgi:ankyrin repeat protein
MIIFTFKHDDIFIQTWWHFHFKYEMTPLHFACQQGSFQIAEILINKNCNINAKTNNFSIFHFHSNMMTFSFKHNSIHIQTWWHFHSKYEMTPLHFACKNGSFQIVEMLINKNCDINAKANNFSIFHSHSNMIRFSFKHDYIHIQTWLHSHSNMMTFTFKHDYIHIQT